MSLTTIFANSGLFAGDKSALKTDTNAVPALLSGESDNADGESPIPFEGELVAALTGNDLPVDGKQLPEIRQLIGALAAADEKWSSDLAATLEQAGNSDESALTALLSEWLVAAGQSPSPAAIGSGVAPVTLSDGELADGGPPVLAAPSATLAATNTPVTANPVLVPEVLARLSSVQAEPGQPNAAATLSQVASDLMLRPADAAQPNITSSLATATGQPSSISAHQTQQVIASIPLGALAESRLRNVDAHASSGSSPVVNASPPGTTEPTEPSTLLSFGESVRQALAARQRVTPTAAGRGGAAIAAGVSLGDALPAGDVRQTLATGLSGLINTPLAEPGRFALNGQPAVAITRSVGSEGWGEQFSQKVGWVIRAGLPGATISLNPDHLGPVEMTVEVEDGLARIQFGAVHQTTREAIEQSLPRLRELLEEQGLGLDQADVGDFSGDRRAMREESEQAAMNDAQRANTIDDTADEQGEGAVAIKGIESRSLIDTFV